MATPSMTLKRRQARLEQASCSQFLSGSLTLMTHEDFGWTFRLAFMSEKCSGLDEKVEFLGKGKAST